MNHVRFHMGRYRFGAIFNTQNSFSGHFLDVQANFVSKSTANATKITYVIVLTR